MAYTVIKLINAAYYVSGITSREFEEVQGSQLEDGFGMLNDIIADKTIEKDMIPYYLKYTFNAVAGQESYFIPGLEQLETLVFFINDIRYQMRETERTQYFGSSRANNINSLPFNWHLERCYGGSNLYMYFKPNSNYPMEAWGLFRLAEVELNQDLSLTLDRFYINYLKFALAERICMEFNYIIPAGVSLQLRKYEGMIQSRSAKMDLTQQKMSTLSNGSTLNMGIVNLSGGFTT